MTKQLKWYQAWVINDHMTQCGIYKLQVVYFIDSGHIEVTNEFSGQPSIIVIWFICLPKDCTNKYILKVFCIIIYNFQKKIFKYF